jgi:uncharacterized membrane protein
MSDTPMKVLYVIAIAGMTIGLFCTVMAILAAVGIQI